MELIPRYEYLEKIKKSLEKVPITVLIGARQVGKTSLINSFDFKGSKVQVDGQLPEINEIFSKSDQAVEFLKIYLNDSINGLLIIDEFQMINNISPVLKILVDNFPKLKILCSGSSSLEIVQKVKESLAGRVRFININSLSFSESILFKYDDILFDEYKSKYTLNTGFFIINNKIKTLLDYHLIYGGMPRVWLENEPEEKRQTLYDIYQTYLLRDIRSYVKNEDSVGFNRLLQMLALQIGNLVNINELSRSTKLSYYKCEEYLYLLEQMFIIKMIKPFETNKRNALKKMKKVYFLDLGIRNILIKDFNTLDIRLDSGALFENFIFLEIIKNTKPYSDIEFFRTKDGAEIDFIINDMSNTYSIEAKYKYFKKPTYIKTLKNFNEIKNIKKSFLINLNLNSVIDNIHFLPVYLTEKIFNG